MFQKRSICIESILLLISFISSDAQQNCPNGCTCKKATVCTGPRTSIPNNLVAPSYIMALTIYGTQNSQNSLGHITSSMFYFKNLWHLKLDYCGIDSIEDGAFKMLPALKTLSLEFNEITSVNKGTFEGLNYLIKLDLSGNENCNMATGTFDSLLTLQELSLAEMNLMTLDPNLLKPLKKLVVLDIHGNKLQNLDWSVFKSFPILKRIDLSGNQLTTIPSDMSTIMERLSSINLENNPWICNWKMKWLRDNKASFNVFVSRENLICDSPDELKFMSLINVPDPKLDPIVPKVVRCNKNRTNVNEGFSLTINCEIKGDPYPTIIWANQIGTEYNIGTKTGYTVFKNGTLYIDQVSSVDNGDWTLQLTSQFGEDRWRVHVNVVLSTTTTTTTTTPTTTTTTSTTTTTTSTTTTTKPTTTTTTPTTSTTTPITTTPTTTHLPATTTFPTTLALNVSTKAPLDDSPNMLMYYAAGGGGGLLLVLLTTIICCKKCKKKPGAVDDSERFDSVKTPRKTPRPTRVNVAPHRHAYY